MRRLLYRVQVGAGRLLLTLGMALQTLGGYCIGGYYALLRPAWEREDTIWDGE